MTAKFFSLSRMWVVSALLLVLMSGSAFAKDPTLKERVTALAAAGKSIAVVYWPCFYSGEVTEPAKSLAETTLFNGGTIPASYSAIGQTALESFNKGFSVTAFSLVDIAKIPMKKSWTGDQTPVWTTLDNEMFVSVGVFFRNKLILNNDKSKNVKLTVFAKIEIMENIVDKKGKKESSNIKTLNVSVSSKAVPATGTVATQADFEKFIPSDSVLEELKVAVDQEIAKYLAKQ